jgi:hypothetical protein
MLDHVMGSQKQNAGCKGYLSAMKDYKHKIRVHKEMLNVKATYCDERLQNTKNNFPIYRNFFNILFYLFD